jgi:hypothetical protein
MQEKLLNYTMIKASLLKQNKSSNQTIPLVQIWSKD